MSSNFQREHWGSRMGFVLAAAGSAVGLGNIWKFPYITSEFGGGSFVLVYLVCIVLVGFPLVVAEMLVGRSTQTPSLMPSSGSLGARGSLRHVCMIYATGTPRT